MTTDQLAELIERRTDALREGFDGVRDRIDVLICDVAGVRTDVGVHAVRLARLEYNGVETKATAEKRRALRVSLLRDLAVALVGAALACVVKGCS